MPCCRGVVAVLAGWPCLRASALCTVYVCLFCRVCFVCVCVFCVCFVVVHVAWTGRRLTAVRSATVIDGCVLYACALHPVSYCVESLWMAGSRRRLLRVTAAPF
jgi:hypothetical protein